MAIETPPLTSPAAAGGDSSPSHGRGNRLTGLVRTARPRQWVKNVLVLAAPGAAGVLGHQTAVARSAAAFVAFCLASSGTYFLNDAFDHRADALHPVKRHRPVASGLIPVRLAQGVGAVLLLASLALPLATGLTRLAVVVAIYVGLTVAYSARLKREPVIELAAVAAGFVLRAIAGGVAVGVVLSNWFLIVASFGALFMVAGKRTAEMAALGDDHAAHRSALSAYSVDFLRYVRTVTSGVAITAYCLWAFEKAGTARHGIWFELTIVPFLLAILRYALLLDHGEGGAPEDAVLQDRPMLVLALLWVAVFALGIYA